MNVSTIVGECLVCKKESLTVKVRVEKATWKQIEPSVVSGKAKKWLHGSGNARNWADDLFCSSKAGTIVKFYP